MQLAVLNLLTREFYDPANFEKGISAFTNSIEQNNEHVICLLINETVVGVTSYRTYDWLRLSAQLYIQARFKENKLSAIRLQHLSDLLTHCKLGHNYLEAVELAYSVVDKEYRGQGYGRILYVERLRRVTQLPDPNSKLIFNIARSDFAGTDLRRKLLEVLLQHEKRVHGQFEDGHTIVKGVWMDASEISPMLGVDITSLTPLDGSVAIVHQAQKYGLRFVGYYTNLSPVYAAYLPEIVIKFQK